MRIVFGSIFFRVCLVLCGVTLPCFILEAELRIEQLLRKGIPLSTNPNARWDAELGWLGSEHILGATSHYPIVVIGDSFTEGMTVASDKMWFAALRAIAPEEQIIAYGGLGYGTLQELLILRSYLNKGIVPSLIVLQLCSNDIINNYYPLEQESYLQRPPAPRPYLEGEDIEIRFPRRYGGILLPLLSLSRVASQYSNRWDRKVVSWAGEQKIESVEVRIQREGAAYSAYRQAIAVTDRLLRKVNEAAGHTRLVLMLIDDLEPYTSALREIAHKYRIPIVSPSHEHGVPESGRLPDGAHLNEEGNQLIGQRFVELARNKGIFNDLPLGSH